MFSFFSLHNIISDKNNCYDSIQPQHPLIILLKPLTGGVYAGDTLINYISNVACCHNSKKKKKLECKTIRLSTFISECVEHLIYCICRQQMLGNSLLFYVLGIAKKCTFQVNFSGPDSARMLYHVINNCYNSRTNYNVNSIQFLYSVYCICVADRRLFFNM